MTKNLTTIQFFEIKRQSVKNWLYHWIYKLAVNQWEAIVLQSRVMQQFIQKRKWSVNLSKS